MKPYLKIAFYSLAFALNSELSAQVEQRNLYYEMRAGDWEDAPELWYGKDSVIVVVQARIKNLICKADDVPLKALEKINGEYFLYLKKGVQYFLTFEREGFIGIREGPIRFPISRRIKIDVSEIERPVILSHTIQNEWVNGNLRISARVESMDTVASVILFYRLRNDTTYNPLPMQKSTSSAYQGLVPVKKQTTEFYIKAFGREEIYNIWPDADQPYRVLAQPDTVAPKISHSPDQDVIRKGNNGIELRAQVKDDVGIEKVDLYYRYGGQEKYQIAEMENPTDEKFTKSFANRADTLEYFIRAEDLAGKLDVAPDSGKTYKFAPNIFIPNPVDAKGLKRNKRWLWVGGGGLVVAGITTVILLKNPTPDSEGGFTQPVGRPR